MTITGGQSATQLANAIAGKGVTISNAVLTCNSLGYGTFVNTNSNAAVSLAIDSGVILTNGRAITNGVNYGVNSNYFNFANNIMSSVPTPDADILSLLPSSATFYDMCKLTFDVVPTGDSLYIKYAFASDEYPTYNCYSFNDAFGIFKMNSGTGTNYSKVPGTNIPVLVNTINNGSVFGTGNLVNCTQYGAGSPFTAFYVTNNITNHIVYNGFTQEFTARIPVTPFVSQSIKIVIVDVVDGQYDSGLFLRKNGLSSNPLLEITDEKGSNGSSTPPKDLIEGCNNGTVQFKRSSSASPLTVNVTMQGTASPSDYTTLSTFTIPTGSLTYTYNVGAVADALVEPTETLKLIFSAPSIGFIDTVDYFIKDYAKGISIFNATNDTSVCFNTSVSLYADNTDTSYQINWLPAGSLSCSACLNPIYSASLNNSFDTIQLTARISKIGCPTKDSIVKVYVQPSPIVALPGAVTLCKGDSIILTPTVIPASNNYTYSWAPNPTLSSTTIKNPIAKPTSSQTYSVTVSTSAGCSGTTNQIVNFNNIRPELASLTSVTSSCGQSNGSITFIPTSPLLNPPYLYSINGGSSYLSTGNFTGLAGGIYAVSFKNNLGCKFDTSLNIATGSIPPTATYSKVNTTCGNNNGSATITNTTGTGPFTYEWRLGATVVSTATSISNVVSGTYTLKVTDNAGCFTQYVVTIGASSKPTANVSKANETCSNSNGTIVLTQTGGKAPFIYNWSNGAGNVNTQFNLSAGTYYLTITDSNLCVHKDTIVLINTTPPITSKNKVNSSCGQPTGMCQVMVTSGIPKYTYAWSTGASTPPTYATSHSINGLLGGTYYCTVTDSNGCKAYDTFIITSTPSVNLSSSVNMATCNKANGAINVSIIGGVPPFTYIWNDGATTQSRINITGGLYSLTVTDSNGCSSNQSFLITTTTPPSINYTQINPKCGVNNGSISTNTLSGTAPISYQWNTGAVTPSISFLGAGTYILTVTDANGCKDTQMVTLIMHPAITFDTSFTQTTCGKKNGTMTVSNISGTSPFSVVWSDGNTSLTRTGIANGTYTVLITDSAGCNLSKSFVIDTSNNPDILMLKFNAFCNDTVGKMKANVTAGVMPYTYQWSNGSVLDSIINIPTGVLFTLTVTDARGCKDTLSDSIQRKPNPKFNLSVQNPKCGINNGVISVINLNATSSVTYNLNFIGEGIVPNFIDLDTGKYIIQVKDANGCKTNDTVKLTTKGQFKDTMLLTHPTCGDTNGTASVVITGGNPPYNITWMNGKKTLSIDSLYHGQFVNYTIIDSLGCYSFNQKKMRNISNLGASLTVNVTRCDTVTGKCIVVATGGTPSYKYYWDNSSTYIYTTTKDSLIYGPHTLTIVDTNKCRLDTTFGINYDHYVNIYTSVKRETCDSNNGYVIIDSIVGGVIPIKIYWNNILDSVYAKTNISGPFSYDIKVVDSFLCQKVVTKEVEYVQPFPPIKNVVLPSCGANTGSITYSIKNNRDSLFKFSWNSGSTSNTLTNLGPGLYKITVTDAEGCHYYYQDSLNYTIPPSNYFTVSRPNCGKNDGLLTAHPSSIYGIVRTDWFKNGIDINQRNVNTIGSLSPGVYVFKIEQIYGCIKYDTVVLIDSPPPVISFQTKNSNCANGVGKLKAVPITGKAPYTYFWNTLSTIDSIQNLTEGKYFITVTDARGCIRYDSATIVWNKKPDISLLKRDSYCDTSNGKITTTITNGTGPFQFNWNSGDTTQNLINKKQGTYILTVTDIYGCQDFDTASIITTAPLKVSLSKVDVNCGIINGQAIATIQVGTPPFVFNWNNLANTLIYSGQDTGWYVFSLIDSNLCSFKDSVHINRLSIPTISFNITNDNCTYYNGQILSTVSGGKTPYTYSWSNGINTQNLLNITGGSYTLTITDSLGCVISKPATVLDTLGPVIFKNIINPKCGIANGSIVTNVVSNYGPISYFWNGTPGTSSKININGGKYALRVVDNRGCIKHDTTVIDTSFVLDGVAKPIDPSCNLNNGSIKIKTTGGKPPYSYTWNSTSLNIDSIFGLAPGGYNCTVTDIDGCLDSTNNILVQQGMPVINLTTIPSKCRQANGKLIANIASTNTFNYSWSNGSNKDSAVNLLPGVYTLTATNLAGCTATSWTTLNSIGVDSATANTQDPKCGLNNGFIKVNPINKVGPISYTWSNAQTTDSVSGLSPGSYSVTMIDSLNCAYVYTKNLIYQPPPVLSSTPKYAHCNLNNGQITTSLSGGKAPLNYQWNSGQTSPSIIGIDSGFYKLILTDINGCKDSVSYYIQRIPMLTYTYSTVNSLCDLPNGKINGTTTGGKTNYVYSWNSGQTTQSLTNVYSGSYNLTVTDSLGCQITKNIVLNGFTKPDIQPTVKHAVCGQRNGSISVSILKGTPPFDYTWSNGKKDTFLDSLSANTSYILTVVDFKGCSDTLQIDVLNGPVPQVYFNKTNSTCGLNNGQIIASMPRGIEPINYIWSTGINNDSLNKIPAGLYFITITDAQGCDLRDSIYISTTTIPKITLSSTNAFCLKANGTITSSVVDGTAPFSYNWSNGAISKDLNGVISGTYKLILTDSVFCKDSASITVAESPNTLTANSSTVNLKCYNDNSGQVTINASGGTAPYQYQYDGGSFVTNNQQQGFSSGSHTFTVKDNNGCLYSGNFTLTQPNPISIKLNSFENIKCYGENTGEISINAEGGTLPYTYSWSPNGGNYYIASSLKAGNYTITVKDANNCSSTFTHKLNQPDSLKVIETIINNNCNGEKNGTISLNVLDATPPYTYLWSNKYTTQVISNLAQGNYQVTITDANKCKRSYLYSLVDPPKLTIDSIYVRGITCKGELDGIIKVFPNGGTPPFLYSIDSGVNFQANNVFKNLQPKTYIVVAKDAKSCQFEKSATIKNFQKFEVNAQPDMSTLQLGESVQLSFNIVAGDPTAMTSFLWSPSQGLTCVDCVNPTAEPYTSTDYIITVNYYEDCIAYDTVHVIIQNNNQVYIPNSFAPGMAKDSQNRIIKIYANDVLTAELSIFDRWGEKVFSTNEGNKVGWDGTYKGKPAMMDVYYYVAKITFLDQKIVEKKGTINLIR